MPSRALADDALEARHSEVCECPHRTPEPMRRTLLQPLLALALGLVVVAPASAVEPGGAGKETLRGTLQGVFIETFKEAHPRESHVLRTAKGDVPLEFADG